MWEDSRDINQQNYAGSTLQSTRITISFCCLSFQTPCVYHIRKINFHSFEETHLSTNDGEKTTFDKILS